MAALQHRFLRVAGGAVAWTIDDFNKDGPDDVLVKEIRAHLDAAGGAVGNVNMIVSIESAKDSAYSAVISSTDMTALTDKFLQPDYIIRAVDHLKIVYANGSGRLIGFEVITRPATEWD